jgi:hypothetical protein
VEREGFEAFDSDADMSLDGIIPPDDDTDELGQQPRPPSFPAARVLLAGTSKRAGTIIPETQLSASVSQLNPQATTSAKRFLPKTDGKVEATGELANDSGYTNIKPISKRGLAPVPAISPSTFEAYLSKAPAGPPKSQISSIDTFESPSNGKATIHKTKNHERKPACSQRRKKSVHSQLRQEGSKSDNDRNSVLHDPIEDFDIHPSDQVLKLRGAEVAEAARLRQSSHAPSKPPKRPLSDFISRPIPSRLNDTQSHLDRDDDAESKGWALEVESVQVCIVSLLL